MNKEVPAIEEEFDQLAVREKKDVQREKFDLSSTRVVLERLEREGLIGQNDKLEDIKKVVEEEFRRIEDI
ncbi:MAG: hypothetical protein A2750_02590 [Candidatus Yanofskybacteria bacterium RIFCSPHIGHO2_01_FULL_45_42]|uniref:Uncharacterized protein n=2 Tax=Candidatus Yanofskyibacteriota TaxID=1752733 RepID=A0A1F8FJI3_9BACT|nr:MAG: hypothetical protein A2750_02590 [Candidatus Yanofskybacteria bacterium RIFCSPHIGHO2_01_FULL_45_42]OGN12890.1 MAG: hypothetical protein A3J47_00065 [Candidatus Yanofskybacteria bacterium RIFCSPHIGHO2_02_FULL_43_22]